MSEPDIVAERDVLAPPAHATKLPLVGLTVGADGYWSARFWIKSNEFRRHCVARFALSARTSTRCSTTTGSSAAITKGPRCGALTTPGAPKPKA